MELPLRDIHLSDPISWWPIAFGWWIAFGVVAMAIFLIVFFLRKYLKPTTKKEAVMALDQIEKSFIDNGDGKQCLCALSNLLRRVSVKVHSAEYAGLTGDAWLQVLDKSLKEPLFSQGAGRILIHAPYQPHVDIKEASEMIKLCRNWVNSL